MVRNRTAESAIEPIDFGSALDKTPPRPELEQIKVYLSESAEPLTFEADPDEGDDPDEPDQFHGLMADLELGFDSDDFIDFVDVDGETAWIKASEIALLELPSWLLDSELLDKEEESTDGEGEDTGSTGIKDEDA